MTTHYIAPGGAEWVPFSPGESESEVTPVFCHTGYIPLSRKFLKIF